MGRYFAPRLLPITNGLFHPFDFRSINFKEVKMTCVRDTLTFTQFKMNLWRCIETNETISYFGLAYFLNDVGLNYNVNCALLEMSVTDPYLRNPGVFRIPRKFLYKINYNGNLLSVTPIEVAPPMKTCDIW